MEEIYPESNGHTKDILVNGGLQQPLSSNNFYNTIHLKGDELKEAKDQVSIQEAKVLSFFAQHPHVAFTPFEVADRFNAWPITSVRRAITNLTNKNYLVKTDTMKSGKYGKPNFTWKLNPVQ